MKRRAGRLLLLLLILAAGMWMQAAAAEDGTHVVILGTSDMHGDIWGWSYEDGEETDNNGMARLYTYIEQIRAEYPVTFLVDGGDDLQGTILTDDIANKEPDEPHPVIAAMNFMGYDAMTLGNHEFNWGVPNMLKMLRTAEFPVLSQNIRNADGELLTGAGWTIAEHGGVRLAVIGVTTPMIQRWDGGKNGIDDLRTEAASEAVKLAIAEIGDRADLIMVSAHMGLDAEFDEEGGSDSARKILEDNPEVDVLLVAHLHITVRRKEGNVPVGGVRNSGREIARFDLILDEEGNVTDAEIIIADMAGVEPSEEIREIPLVREAHEKAVLLAGVGLPEDVEQGPPLGYTTAKFQPENEILDIPEGRLRDTPVIDLILKVQTEVSGSDVSCTPLYTDTGDLPEGAVYYKDIFSIYKFDNTLCRLTVTGAELRNILEWSARHYNRWVPGDINISFDLNVPGYLYDMFSGVEYEINLSKPKGERIENVMFRGRPLQDDDELTLSLNNYRYASAIRAENLAAGTREWESSESVRDMIVAYFGQNSPVEPETDHNWRITGIDLCEDDPRRAELIGYINEGLLPVPYNESYNLADYESLAAQAEENRKNAGAGTAETVP